MTDDAALLAAIRDRPDDDTPRLLYADWCDDNGQPERAAFVRAQVELARVPACPEPRTGLMPADHAAALLRWQEDHGPRHGELTRRQWSLLPIGGFHPDRACGVIAYCPPMPTHGGGPREGGIVAAYRRGFVDELRCPAADWLQYGDAILAAHPVRRVTLTTRPYVGVHDANGLRARETYPDKLTYWLADAPDYRYTLAQIAAELGIPADRALRENEAVEGVSRLRWPGVAFELPPPAPLRYEEAVALQARQFLASLTVPAELLRDAATGYAEVMASLIPVAARMGEAMRDAGAALRPAVEAMAAALPEMPDVCDRCGEAEPSDYFAGTRAEGWFCADCLSTARMED